jgi:hypothetical protein
VKESVERYQARFLDRSPDIMIEDLNGFNFLFRVNAGIVL